MKCAVCSKEADKSCSGCKTVSYCSLDHQKEDWKNHRNYCSPCTVTNSKDGGKVLTLIRNVDQGTILVDEKPIFHLPEMNGVFVESVCLTCGLHMTYLTSKKCSICAWPVCSLPCQMHSAHEQECELLAKSKTPYSQEMLFDLPSIMTLIRAVCLKRNSSKTWQDLIALQDGVTDLDAHGKSQMRTTFKKYIKKLLPTFTEREQQEAMEDGLILRRIILRRGFYVNAQDTLDTRELQSTGKWRAGFYIYKKASHVTHSCVPNSVWSTSNFPDFTVRIRASYPLAKGQVVTVNHLEHHAEGRKGTVERRIGFCSRFGRICMCDLCCDPTEHSTFSSAIVCDDCRGPKSSRKVVTENLGYFLPDQIDSIGYEGNIPWRCNSCQKVIPISKFYPTIEKIITALESNDGKSIDFLPMKAEHFSKNLIQKYRDSLLHPNHWLIQKATHILIDEGFRDIHAKPVCSDKEVEELVGHCKYLMKILNQIHPGFCGLKSKLMQPLGAAVKAQMDKAVSNEVDENAMGLKMLAYLEELIELKEDLVTYYKNDLPLQRGLVKSEMAEKFETDLNELKAIRMVVRQVQSM